MLYFCGRISSLFGVPRGSKGNSLDRAPAAFFGRSTIFREFLCKAGLTAGIFSAAQVVGKAGLAARLSGVA